MPRKNPKCPILEELRKATIDEQCAVEFMERRRWGSKPGCPRCGDIDVYRMTSRAGGRNENFRWRCRGCQRMYTVRTGIVMEESRLPLRVWVYAFWKACASKKGISALQLSREMEITHKSALFVLRRIRHGLTEVERRDTFSDTFEVDETYVGGKPRHKGQSKRGRGTSKTPVMAIAERGGGVRFQVMDRLNSKHLEVAIVETVEASARMMTDELSSYGLVGRRMQGGHERVTHSAGEYVRPGTTPEVISQRKRRGFSGCIGAAPGGHHGCLDLLDDFRLPGRPLRGGAADDVLARVLRKLFGASRDPLQVGGEVLKVGC